MVKRVYETFTPDQVTNDMLRKAALSSTRTTEHIIIGQETIFPTADALQQFANLPSLPEIETTTTAPMPWEDENLPPADHREVQICDVNWNQLVQIEGCTEGESINVWFKKTKRSAWVARSLKQKTPTVGGQFSAQEQNSDIGEGIFE